MRSDEKECVPTVSRETPKPAAWGGNGGLPIPPDTEASVPLMTLGRLWRSVLSDVQSRISSNRQTINSVAAVSSGITIASLLRIAGGLLIARFLGPNETGLFQSYTIPLVYLSFLHLGTFDGLYRQIPYYIGKDVPERAKALASAAGAWNIRVAAVVSSGFVICACYGAWRHDWLSVAGWLSQALLSWDSFYGGFLTATYRTVSHFKQMARMAVQQAALAFALVFSLPFIGFYGLCLRVSSVATVGTWLYHRHRPIRVPYRYDQHALKEVIRVGLPFSFWGSLYTTAWTATESALMLALGGITGLGLLAVAAVIREGMNILPVAVNQVVMPRVVETFAREGTIRRSNRRLLWVTAGLTGFMLAVVAVVSYLLDFLVPVVFPKYIEGLPLMKTCLWFAVVQAAALPLNTIFAMGKSWVYGRGVIIGLVVFLGAAYLLTPIMGGILAVATGSLMGRVSRTLITYLEILVLTRREAAETRREI